jgi:tellurite resistance protein
VVPERLRTAAFAVFADLVLADGKIEQAERRFLERLASELGLDHRKRDGLVHATLVEDAA